MTAWSTVRKRISMDTKQPESGEAKDAMNLAMSDALGLLRTESYWFNVETDYTFPTVASQQAYATPADYIGRTSDVYIDQNQEPATRRALHVLTKSEFDFSAAGVVTATLPRAIMFYDENMYLYPTPGAVHDVIFSYIKDLGCPEGTYSGSAWSWVNSLTGAAISNIDTFTNDWFKAEKGMYVLLNRAKKLFEEGYLRNNDHSEINRSNLSESIFNARKMDDKRNTVNEIRPFIWW